MMGGTGQYLLNLLLPPRCLACGTRTQAAGLVCGDCWGALDFIQGPVCGCCGFPFDFNPGMLLSGADFLCGACQKRQPAFDQAWAALRYDEGSRAMVLAFKHGDRMDYTDFFSRLLLQVGLPLSSPDTVVIPVPLHRKRLQKRRYNQAALIGRRYADKRQLDYIPDMLCRTKYTPPQEGNSTRRKRNVAGAFRLKGRYQDRLSGKAVIIIDDVYTTGATAEACARILKQAGATRVDVLTVARVCRATHTG